MVFEKNSYTLSCKRMVPFAISFSFSGVFCFRSHFRKCVFRFFHCYSPWLDCLFSKDSNVTAAENFSATYRNLTKLRKSYALLEVAQSKVSTPPTHCRERAKPTEKIESQFREAETAIQIFTTPKTSSTAKQPINATW